MLAITASLEKEQKPSSSKEKVLRYVPRKLIYFLAFVVFFFVVVFFFFCGAHFDFFGLHVPHPIDVPSFPVNILSDVGSSPRESKLSNKFYHVIE
jgi:hypothetical protein